MGDAPKWDRRVLKEEARVLSNNYDPMPPERHRELTCISSIFEQSPAIEGLLRKGELILEKFDIPSIRDAAIITIAQRIEHYEMAVYGTLRTYANHLEFNEVEDLLQENLKEEGHANKKLTEIAQGGFFTSGVNQKALSM